jgi:hypothetical protein
MMLDAERRIFVVILRVVMLTVVALHQVLILHNFFLFLSVAFALE